MAATKVKKPEICTYWWEKVVQYEPTHEEALTELYKLYERNKEWDKLADICQQAGRRGVRRRSSAPTRCSASACSTPRRSRTAPRRSTPGSGCSQIDENNRRAQDALKKLYVTEGRWDDLEEFYRSRGKIDEYIRVLEREVEAGSEHASARARDEDRGALPRRAAEGRPRDARVREGARSSTRTTSRPPRR